MTFPSDPTGSRTFPDIDEAEEIASRSSLVKCVEILGEAASRVTEETRRGLPCRSPQPRPWSEVGGLPHRYLRRAA